MATGSTSWEASKAAAAAAKAAAEAENANSTAQAEVEQEPRPVEVDFATKTADEFPSLGAGANPVTPRGPRPRGRTSSDADVSEYLNKVKTDAASAIAAASTNWQQFKAEQERCCTPQRGGTPQRDRRGTPLRDRQQRQSTSNMSSGAAWGSTAACAYQATAEYNKLVDELASIALYTPQSPRFAELHARALKVMPEMTPGSDPAAVLALSLACAVAKSPTQEKSVLGLNPIPEWGPNRASHSHSPSRAAFHPMVPGSPSRSAFHPMVATPCHQLTSAGCVGDRLTMVPSKPIPSSALPHAFSSPGNWHSADWAAAQAQARASMGIRQHSADRPRASSLKPVVEPRRKPSKYTVVNPTTGEKVVISCVVPFAWRASKRLRIVDPKTGEEILPRSQSAKDELRWSAQEASPMPARRDSTATARTSMGSVASDCGRLSISSARSERSVSCQRQRRTSIAGGAVKDGSTWALEPSMSTSERPAFWDWPMSRQEKKDRVLLLSQLDLQAEIEELTAMLEQRGIC